MFPREKTLKKIISYLQRLQILPLTCIVPMEEYLVFLLKQGALSQTQEPLTAIMWTHST
jgi:hypothetical protein